MKRFQLQDYPGFLRIKAFDCDLKSGVIVVIPRLEESTLRRMVMNTAEIIFHHVEQFPETVQSEVLDFVLFLQHKSNLYSKITIDERRHKLREAMRCLQQANVYSEIDNPVNWQRDIRADRHLPVREN
jgi:hypothetical protein